MNNLQVGPPLFVRLRDALVRTARQRPLSQPVASAASGRDEDERQAAQDSEPGAVGRDFEIAPDDPLVAYLLKEPIAVEIEKLDLGSPAVAAMRSAGIKLCVPLVSQGELVGLLNLGARLSQQDYSADDRSLLNTLAAQAAPAVRVAQLVREQQSEVQERERIEHELRVARMIQRTLLPKDVPELSGWELAACYEPAREVGGDFYDFLYLDDGRLGIVIGDVTDKGVPAALVMATTRSILRGAAQGARSPGKVLEQANELLCPDMPPKMFVTCFYAILDPASGAMRYANAGHDLPYRRHDEVVSELRATGMPLGLLPGMRYEEGEMTIEPGDSVLFYSDGLVEAHDVNRAMFGFPRLMSLLAGPLDDAKLIGLLLGQLARFTGPDWEQEDDVTLVTLRRAREGERPSGSGGTTARAARARRHDGDDDGDGEEWRTLAELRIPSTPGNERLAMAQVAEAVRDVALTPAQRERLKTAVAEATMNAMEHGNGFRSDVPVLLAVRVSAEALVVRISDEGGDGQVIPEAATPDLDAKLAGNQSPRGWGLFLIRNLVDEMRVWTEGGRHIIELVLRLGERGDDGQAVRSGLSES